MRNILIILFIVTAQKAAWGQLNNTVFENRLTIQESDSGKLFLGIRFLGFSKNNEYFDTIIEGYTLLGYQIHPSLSYFPSKNIRLDAGFYAQQDFGNHDLSTAVPTLSLKVTRGPFALVFGNIDGNLNHRLIEPLYNFERVLNNRLETGIQLQSISDELFFDLWLDWQHMIYNKDPEQEYFVSGMSIDKRIFKNGAFQISVPLQVLMSHRGGQINLTSLPVETLMNAAIGAEIQHTLSGSVKGWRANGYYVLYNNMSTADTRPYRDGSGYYFNGNISTGFGLDVMMSYWQAHEFISVQGGKIYPSVSEFDYRVQQEHMQLFILRLLYNKELAKGLVATLRAEPYYDFSYRSIQFAYGFYLQFQDRFFITSKK